MLVALRPGEAYARVAQYRRCPDGYQSECRTATLATAEEAAAWNARGTDGPIWG
jgi:hypothetical protein